MKLGFLPISAEPNSNYYRTSLCSRTLVYSHNSTNDKCDCFLCLLLVYTVNFQRGCYLIYLCITRIAQYMAHCLGTLVGIQKAFIEFNHMSNQVPSYPTPSFFAKSKQEIPFLNISLSISPKFLSQISS